MDLDKSTDKDYFIAYLNILQLNIQRMAQNSFMVKGWAIVLLVALIGYCATSKNISIFLLSSAYVPVFILWWLDTYYLKQERLIRNEYDHVVKLFNEKKYTSINLFQIKKADIRGKKVKYLFSPSVWPIYIVLCFVLAGLIYIAKEGV